MDKIYKRVLSIVSLSLFFTFCLPAQKASAQYDDAYISYNNFYENLAPYGIWIDDPQYGYVWSPEVDGSFRPYYTNGHWVMTDYGNTWISDYPWGWACFHYGRWIFDSYYGWLWIPGSNWGPAWVSWRFGEGYYGWAPLGPGYEFGSSSYNEYNCPNDWWVFIPPQYLYTGNYYRYWYGPHSNSTILHNTVFINNTYENNHNTYVSGPRVRDVEQVTGKPVQTMHLTNSNSLNTSVHNNIVKMYRPAEIRPAATINGQRAVPPNAVKAPQPVRAPQAVNAGQTTPPQFRNNVPKDHGRPVTPGTNFNETAKPAQQPARNDHNPYEWDVNKQQHNKDDYSRPEQSPNRAPEQPRQQSAPRNEAPRQAPSPQPQPRQQPAPAQQPQPRPAPAPAQPQRTPAPAPNQAPRESGTKR